MAMVRTALLYFDQAIRDGSIRRAAENLHIAASAVNRQILQLEAELGVELFVRLPRGIRPTAAGEALLNYVRRWNKEALFLQEEVELLKGGMRGTIRIAAAESLMEDIVPNAMTRMRRTSPHIDFTLISGDNHRIKAELMAREADLVCGFDLTENGHIQIIQTIDAPIGVISRPDHPIAALGQATLRDCLPHPIVLPDSDWLKHSIMYELVQDRIPFRVIARTERIGMLKSLVRSGFGIAFLSIIGLHREITEGKLSWTPLAKGIIRPTSISLAVSRGTVLSPLTAAFAELIRDELLKTERRIILESG